VQSGHLSRDGERIAVTASGRLVLEAILGEIAARTISVVAAPRPESAAALPPARQVAAC
jgi:hypothetical protein